MFGTFFKIFFLVVTFGLFHGLATLPVLLATFGPDTHAPVSINDEDSIEVSDTNKKSSHTNNDVLEDNA